ncbi:hypothetical protein BpHYR1_014499 [Brachionus plicatilis]|uniref:Uncharacterized protein n=1 Tax=Brachionus plicatilis TaxID=10195 RepID=A0A3M7QGL3_BRAPC|nr:hypothetical protein BpHYR1_014499 [Brachionus plicatilis]
MQYMHSMAQNQRWSSGQAALSNNPNPTNFNLAKDSQFMRGQGQAPWSQYGSQQTAGRGPNAKPVIIGQNQQTPNFKQMNQFGQNTKPSPPPVSPQLSIQPNQSYLMPPLTHRQPTISLSHPNGLSEQPKIVISTPHMQQPYTAQVYPNQSQPRAQLMPNRYQASPNKTNPNMDPAANMYQSKHLCHEPATN